MHRVVPAGLVADRPGGAGVGRTGGQRVVAALAVGVADRVDWREVDDVEPEFGKSGELSFDAFEAAPRAREQLVPGAELGELSVDLDLDRFERHASVAGLDPLDGSEQLGAEGDVVLGFFGDGVVTEGLDRVLDEGLVGVRPGRLGGGLEQADALGQLAGEVVLLGGHLAREFVPPRAEHVGPGLDRVVPPTGLVHLEARGPAHAAEVGVDPLHLDLAPVARLRRFVADDGAEDLVAVAEDVGLHGDRVADDALGRVATVVHRRRRVLDHDAGRRRLRRAVGALCGGGRVDLCAHARSSHRKISFLAMGKPFRVNSA